MSHRFHSLCHVRHLALHWWSAFTTKKMHQMKSSQTGNLSAFRLWWMVGGSIFLMGPNLPWRKPHGKLPGVLFSRQYRNPMPAKVLVGMPGAVLEVLEVCFWLWQKSKMTTLPETDSKKHLKRGRGPQKEMHHLPTIDVQGRTASFREGIYCN